MRDPSRIPGVLEKVKEVWEKYPDLRLGQLMWILAQNDPFYIEEDELLVKIEEFLSKK